jgi:hypothetical protein
MLSGGVCVAASTLGAAMTVRGQIRADLTDFSIAFFLVTAVSMSATIWNLRFARDAGETISGHKGHARRLASSGADEVAE